MALATEMSMGEGHDIDLPPGKSITIKVCLDQIAPSALE